jgi:hypothetical protein
LPSDQRGSGAGAKQNARCSTGQDNGVPRIQSSTGFAGRRFYFRNRFARCQTAKHEAQHIEDIAFMKIIVIGHGMVGQKLVECLAQDVAHGLDITVLSEEPRPAYHRVHLSEFFSGRLFFLTS